MSINLEERLIFFFPAESIFSLSLKHNLSPEVLLFLAMGNLDTIGTLEIQKFKSLESMQHNQISKKAGLKTSAKFSQWQPNLSPPPHLHFLSHTCVLRFVFCQLMTMDYFKGIAALQSHFIKMFISFLFLILI